MSLNGILKSKGLVIRQMSTPDIKEKVEQVVEQKVEQVLEEKKEEIREKAEEVAKKVDDAADKVCEKVEDAAEKVIEKLEEIVPGGAKVVEVVDAALAGVSFSCGCLGWKFSVEKTARSPSK